MVRMNKLETDRLILLQQMTLNTLLQPDVWPELRASIGKFKERYATQYRKFHRDYMADITKLREIHARLGHVLLALDRLQGVREIGGGSAVKLRGRWQALAAELLLCSLPPDSVCVDAHPYCDNCKTPFNTSTPRTNLESLRDQVLEEVDAAISQLHGVAVQRVIQDVARHDAEAARLAQAVSAGNNHVIDLIVENDAIIDLVGQLFAQAKMSTVKVVSLLHSRYPTVSKENIDEVVDYFRTVLVQALADAGERGEIELV